MALLAGPLFIALCFALAQLEIEPVATFFYLCAWCGIIYTFDRLIARRQGASLIARCGTAFPLLLFWSAACWFFFEILNLRLQNWYYVFVTDDPALRLAGTFLAFATVFPGIFWIEHYLALRGVAERVRARPLRFSPGGLYLLQAAGILSLALPLLFPRYFFPLVWGALILLLAPVNYRRGSGGLLRQLESGHYGPLLRLLLAGLLAGLFWEFFNYWARARWIYTVPFFEELKLFEMPLLGFVGFAPFAVECAEVYRFLVWQRLAPALGSFQERRPEAGSRALRSALVLAALLFSLTAYHFMNRHTVTSHTPRIERVKPLDAEIAARLQHRGIHYLTDLEGWDADEKWRELEGALGPEHYQRLRRLARLYLHQGIGTEYGNLLVEAGVESLEELGALPAEEVLERLAQVAPAEALPTPARVRVWIRRASGAGDS